MWSESEKQYGTIDSGPQITNAQGKFAGCWYCHRYKCKGTCGGELFGDRCERPACQYCDWAFREHRYKATKLQ